MHTRTDVFECERDLVLEIEVPGVSPGSLQVTLDAVSVEVAIAEPAAPPGRCHRRERARGARSRQIALPCAIDPADVEIGVARGLLSIRAPFASSISAHRRRWTATGGIVALDGIGIAAVEPIEDLGLCSG